MSPTVSIFSVCACVIIVEHCDCTKLNNTTKYLKPGLHIGVRLQSYGTAQRPDFSRYTYTRPHAVLEGCAISWTQAIMCCSLLTE